MYPDLSSKTGNHHLRTAMYMPALSAIRHNPVIINLAGRLQEKGKRPMVIIGAVMRKLLRLAYGVLKTGLPFDVKYHNSHRLV
jgi:transposase